VVLLGHLSGGDDVQRTQCLGLCFVSHLSITGCELIVNQWNAGCYAHTSTRVAQANGAANHWCWLNSASEPGSGSGGGGGSGGSGGGGDGGKEESCTAPCECTLFSNSTGSFTDGSGTEMYSRFSSCRWIIAGGLGAHDGSKCSDHHHDCCAHADWSEPKTCSDGYVAIPKLPAEAPWCVCPDYDGGSACYGCYPPQGGTHDPNPEVPGNYAEYYDLSDTCRHCARDAFVYSPGLAITRGCRNCGCGDGSRMCGCVWCPEIIPESDFFPPGVTMPTTPPPSPLSTTPIPSSPAVVPDQTPGSSSSGSEGGSGVGFESLESGSGSLSEVFGSGSGSEVLLASGSGSGGGSGSGDLPASITGLVKSGYGHCSLAQGWDEIVHATDFRHRYRTGGLGTRLVPGQWHVWLCDRYDPCLGGKAAEDDMMCYAFNEEYRFFLPLGPNSQIKFIKPKKD